jgi:hypothetical protein
MIFQAILFKEGSLGLKQLQLLIVIPEKVHMTVYKHKVTIFAKSEKFLRNKKW